MSTEPVTITKLQSANIKRLIAVEITPDGNLVTIGGKNGAGKSSCLDSIQWALGGSRDIQRKPVRDGERRAKTNVHLSNGLTVTRRYDAASGRSSLVVTDADGDKLRSPQAILDALVGELSFDPLDFERLPAKRQAEIVRELAGVDTSELDAERKRVFDTRTDTNREHKRIAAQLANASHWPDVPAVEVSIAELAEQLEAKRAEVEANNAKRAEAKRLEAVADQMSVAVVRIETDIANARRRLAELEVEREAKNAAAHEAQESADAAAELAAKLADPDMAPIRAELATAEATNCKVRDNQARAQLVASAAAAEHEVELLSDRLEAIDTQRDRMLAEAKLPIAGLGFTWEGVTLGAVPLEQASQAERLRVSVAMGIALNPTLRVLLVRDGSRLDEDNLRAVAKMAKEAGAQVWLEVVSTDERCSVVIEDGMVRGANVTEGAAE